MLRRRMCSSLGDVPIPVRSLLLGQVGTTPSRRRSDDYTEIFRSFEVVCAVLRSCGVEKTKIGKGGEQFAREGRPFSHRDENVERVESRTRVSRSEGVVREWSHAGSVFGKSEIWDLGWGGRDLKWGGAVLR